jgi:adenosylmethionine-8-amino-7-oxononanoate aminotransferase
MLRGFFVTGTDTGIGKTVVSAALVHLFRRNGPVKYWKPIQTGIEQDDDTATVRILAACTEDELLVSGIRLPGAVAPYLAAERQGTRIAVSDVDCFLKQQAEDAFWIVEGAGGPLVPINEAEFMTDLMLHLGLPALLVTRSTLGTIHQTLSTLEVLRSRGVQVAGCVMVGEPNAENRKAIERWGQVEIIAEIPAFRELSAATLHGFWGIRDGGKCAVAKAFPELHEASAAISSLSLISRDRAHVWHPYTQAKTAPPPLPIVRGEGVYLYTSGGRRLLDGISSWWVNIHGHSHPKLNAALAAQARKLEHVVFAGTTHEPAVALSERLVELLPKGLTRIFYSDNGSTAVEVALKMAWQYWRNRSEPQRSEFISLDHAYHGDTFGAMSASGGAFTQPFEELLFSVHSVHAPYCYRCPLGLKRESCAIDCLGALERKLETLAGTVAAVIVEPMLQAAGGMVVWPAEFLAGVRRLCDRFGTLMIADEVLTGFGRTGRMFACEHASVRPDLMCLSKGLTGGYLPLAATAATEEIYEAFFDDDRAKALLHGHSYTANPLGCAVAIASLDLFRDEGTLNRVKALEGQFSQRLETVRKIPCVGDVRGIGGVAIMELESEDSSYFNAIGPWLYDAFLKQGLLLRPLGNILYFMPPYVITEQEIDWAFDRIEQVLRSLARS